MVRIAGPKNRYWKMQSNGEINVNKGNETRETTNASVEHSELISKVKNFSDKSEESITIQDYIFRM